MEAVSPHPSIGLVEVVRDPSQLSQVDRGQIPILLTQLSSVQGLIAARLAAPQDAATETDTLLTIEEAAGRLGVSPDWIYRRTKTLPFIVRVGRHVRCSSQAIQRFIRSRVGR